MRDLPLHTQVLLALKKRAQARQRQLEERTGIGLADQEYQRHVGRIAECKVQIADVEQFMKNDVLDEIEDAEAEGLSEERSEHRAKRRA